MTWLQDNDPAAHVRADPATMSATLDAIIRSPRPVRRRRRKPLILITLTAVLAVVLPIVLRPAPGAPFVLGPAKALAFAKQGDYIDVQIVDPDADPRRYREDFAAHGLKVNLVMEPASPSLVGKVLGIFSPDHSVNHRPDGFEVANQLVKAIEGADCGNFWCLAGVSIPLDLRSPLEISAGRPARPGEQYAVTGDPAAPGEVLEGEDLTNLTVAGARSLLRERNVAVETYYESGYGVRGDWDYSEHTLPPEKIPDSWYVHETWGGHHPGTVRLVVAAAPTDRPLWNFLRSLMFWR
ncbi:hypothetical protein [Herbidospora sp. NBRC 101105]|uniref:hypothetical protein n=1 Tax=Herbidospora sp. NBRC 101105 TaxID=3032195 RepID=UPI00249FD8E9|nr:hypothetical protein [Herbidospora sp. NBRC 101105]GLX96344.1 hypothetical protein Hesp01_42940 [Herbidospora sp. NBRC 101105]